MSKIKVLARLVSSEASFFAVQMATLLLVFTWFFLCMHTSLRSLSYHDTSHIGLEPYPCILILT